MKINKKIVYIGMMILFILWLIYSNTIIISISNVDRPQKIIFREEFSKDYVYFNFDGIQVTNSLKEVFSAGGWAFIETENNNVERYISIILRGKSVCYEVTCKNTFRPDIRGCFPERNIEGDFLGFSSDFSIIEMEDGVYDVYIYCKENETNYGLSFLTTDLGTHQIGVGLQIEKQGDNLQSYLWKAESLKEKVLVSQKENNISWIDFVGVDDGRINISGWSFANNQSCDSQKIYIELVNENGEIFQYTARNSVRDDIAEVYENIQYRNSGFCTSIPLNEIADGTYTVKILLENSAEIWGSEPCKLIKSNGDIKLTGK